MSKQFPDVGGKYGAPMGRRESYHPEYRAAARLFRVRINSGGYDDGGAYWGLGEPLWCCMQRDHDFQVFFRARSRRAAAEYVAAKYPGLRLCKPVPGMPPAVLELRGTP